MSPFNWEVFLGDIFNVQPNCWLVSTVNLLTETAIAVSQVIYKGLFGFSVDENQM